MKVLTSSVLIHLIQPALFENIVNEAIQHLHEVVVMNKPSEPEVRSHFLVREALFWILYLFAQK